MIKNFRLSTKLLIAFSTIAIITAIVGGVGWYGATTLRTHVEEIGVVRLPSVSGLKTMLEGMASVRSAERTLLCPFLTVEDREEACSDYEDAAKRFAEGRAVYEPLPQTPEEAQMWQQYLPAGDTWHNESKAYIEDARALAATHITNPDSLRASLQQFRGDHYKLDGLVSRLLSDNTSFEGGDDPTKCNFGKWLAGFESMDESKNPVLQQTVGEIQEHHKHFHGFVGQIRTLAQSASEEDRLKAEALHAELVGYVDKTLAGFDRMIAEADKTSEIYRKLGERGLVTVHDAEGIALPILEDITALNERIADDETMAAQANSQFTIILATASMIAGVLVALALGALISRTLSKAISLVVDRLREGALQVGSASGQVAQSSQSVAEGASEQASSLEETSASLEELTSMTKQNAASAQQASGMAGQALEASEQGQQSMSRMRDVISRIKSSSDETAKILKTIDEIAFQTNLLALNAAVEAARAGDAGKGFAVVAEEVRSLARRSAEAAKNTATLIEGAQRNAADGVAMSEEVARSLEAIGEQARKVTQLVNEMAAASTEQAQGIEQINTAVSQMDQVTQANAANSEEAASASEELSAQATELNDMVEELSRIVNGAKAGAQDGGTLAIAHAGRAKALPAPVKRPPERRAKALQGTAAPAHGKEVAPQQVIPLDDKDFEGF